MNQQATNNMTPGERRVAFSLAAVYAVRMLGLFMILPVFSLYAEQLQGVTPFLIGLAIGIYGLTQALFQIPLGMLSDRVGRKNVIVGGLLVFAFGSVIAATADSIAGVIAGRALQGGGAIAAATMALAADLTREEHRTKVMAVIGLSIGATFSLALVAGPVLNGWIGVPGIFWLTAGLALIAIAIVTQVVPSPVRGRIHRDTQSVPEAFAGVLRDRQLLRLDLGIFILHLILAANFVVMPLLLRDQLALPEHTHWQVYLPVVLISFLVAVPFVIVAEKHRKMKPVFVGAIALLALAQASWLFAGSLVHAVLTLLAFFAAFNLLEATLPSLISKLAPPDCKGTAMGVYSTSQFFGIFCGGLLGGALYGAYGAAGVFTVGIVAAAIWLIFAVSMRAPSHFSSYVLNIGATEATEAETIAAGLNAMPGVAEAVVIAADGVAYLKVDRRALDEPRLLREFSASPA